MLSLSMDSYGDKIYIGDDVSVTASLKGGKIVLHIDAPRDMLILTEANKQKMERENVRQKATEVARERAKSMGEETKSW